MAYFVHDGSVTYPFTKVDKNSHVTLLAYRGVSSVGASGLVLYPLTAGADCSTESIAVTAADSLEVAAALFLTTNNSTITAPSGVDSRVTRNTSPTLNVVDSAVTPSATTVKTFTMAFGGANRAAVNVVLNGTTGSPTAIAFTGTIPDQVFTNGDSVSVPLAGYFSGTETPFTFANTGTSSAATGLSINGAGELVGTATTGSVTGVICTGTDANLDTASSNAFNITVNAGGYTTPPTFDVAPAVTSISTTTATATATINETGNIYYVVVPQADATPSVAQVKAGQNSAGGSPVDSGSALATTTLTDGIIGLTASTAYKACFVAEDDELTPNIQAAVTTVNFTTSAIAVGTITSDPLSRNSGIASGVVSLTHIDVRLQSTGALTVRKTSVSTDSSSIFTFSDAAITTGETYIVSWRESGGEFGIAYDVVAS